MDKLFLIDLRGKIVSTVESDQKKILKIDNGCTVIEEKLKGDITHQRCLHETYNTLS